MIPVGGFTESLLRSWMPMMADLSEQASRQFSAEELGKWIAMLFFVVGGGLAIRKMTQKPRDPQRTEEVSPPATMDDLNELKNDIMKRLERIDEELDEQRRVARESQGKVHGRIDKVAESLAGVKGELHQINTNLQLLLERSLKTR